MFQRFLRFGMSRPLATSRTTTVILDPTQGFVSDIPSVNLPPGFTPNSENFLMREGAIEPRPMLVQYGANVNPMQVTVTGGREITDVAGTRYPLVSGTTRLAYHTGTQWSALSYVSAFGISAPPAGTVTDYWDMTQVYLPDADQNIAVMANASYQTLYAWKSGTSLFSTLTGAPRAIRVASYDNYVLTINQTDPNNGGQLVQRVQWSDRGSASSWTGGLSGFEDLLDMKGYGTRLITQENRVVIFSDQEIWQGVTGSGPFVFFFSPIDRSVGCPYPWTITDTPVGILFLGRDLQIYLLPKGGGTAQVISHGVARKLRTDLDKPERAWGVYDPSTEQYQLNYPVKGGSGYPQRTIAVDANGHWTPHSYDRAGGNQSASFGFVGIVSSSATSWGGAGTAGLTWANVGSRTWAQMSGTSEERAVIVGSSNGTMWKMSSIATDDDGVGVPCKWQAALGGDDPFTVKTLTRWYTDYTSDSPSSMTIRVSENQGQTFEAGLPVSLPTSSGVTQAVADPYLAARYTVVEVQVQGSRPRLHRFQATMRTGGR